MQSETVRRFASNGALLLGGARAILLQLADPVVGRGVAEHSGFAADPMSRLRNTLGFVYGVMLGTPEQSRTVAGFVDRAHTGIPGALDPERQLWVAATLYETAVTVHENLYGPLEPAASAVVYRSYAALGTALQVPHGMWPDDPAAFSEYWGRTLETLEVTDAAREVARELFAARAAAWWVRLAMPFVRVLTVGMLPAPLRDAFGFVLHTRRYRVALAVARFVARATPCRLREWPSRYYLRRLPAHAG